MPTAASTWALDGRILKPNSACQGGNHEVPGSSPAGWQVCETSVFTFVPATGHGISADAPCFLADLTTLTNALLKALSHHTPSKHRASTPPRRTTELRRRERRLSADLDQWNRPRVESRSMLAKLGRASRVFRVSVVSLISRGWPFFCFIAPKLPKARTASYVTPAARYTSRCRVLFCS